MKTLQTGRAGEGTLLVANVNEAKRQIEQNIIARISGKKLEFKDYDSFTQQVVDYDNSGTEINTDHATITDGTTEGLNVDWASHSGGVSSNDYGYIYTGINLPFDWRGVFKFTGEDVNSTPGFGIGVGTNGGDKGGVVYDAGGQLYYLNGDSEQPIQMGVTNTYTDADVLEIEIDYKPSVNRIYARARKNSGAWSEWFRYFNTTIRRLCYGEITIMQRGFNSTYDDVTFTLFVEDEGKKNNVCLDGTSGNDSNAGSEAAPFATFEVAARNLAAGGTMTIKSGDYRETFDFNLLPRCASVVGNVGENVRFLGSTKITGLTKTAGYTNIYEATTARPIWAQASHTYGVARIFQDDAESLSITQANIHALDRGRSHRLPFTEILSIVEDETEYNTDSQSLSTRLTALDAAPGKFYYRDSKIYIHAIGSDDASIHDFEIPNGDFCDPDDTELTKDLYLDNLTFAYSASGLNPGSLSTRIQRNDVRVYGIQQDDGFIDDACWGVARNCEAAAVMNDGENGHYNELDDHETSPEIGSCKMQYISSWSHDNWDEGISHHEKSDVRLDGCIYEYNGQAGVTFALSGKFAAFNVLCRNNGQKVGASGFSQTTATDDNRQIGSFDAWGCRSTGNSESGFAARTTGITLNLHNCATDDNTDSGYFAERGAIINAYNCKSGDSTAKTGSGTINVINESDLT